MVRPHKSADSIGAVIHLWLKVRSTASAVASCLIHRHRPWIARHHRATSPPARIRAPGVHAPARDANSFSQERRFVVASSRVKPGVCSDLGAEQTRRGRPIFGPDRQQPFDGIRVERFDVAIPALTQREKNIPSLIRAPATSARETFKQSTDLTQPGRLFAASTRELPAHHSRSSRNRYYCLIANAAPSHLPAPFMFSRL